MIRKYAIEVVAIDDVVDEEVVLLVEGIKVKCFASYCPRVIKIGKCYEVEFEMHFPDNDFVVETQEKSKLVEPIGQGFSCVLYGYLDGGIFRSFVDFPGQEIHCEFPYLNEKYVKITVNRIDVAF